ncbi:MAG: pectate lyase [Sedimentisphaerales bacterium]|nr:pectate lyase [Sedimentisphaerales bacterium]
MSASCRDSLFFMLTTAMALGGVPFCLAAPPSIPWKQCLRQEDAWYASGEALRIAENVLLYQRSTGGWPKNTDMAAVLAEEDKARLRSDRNRTDSTIDNGATCRPLRFLARIHTATGDDRCKASCLQGLDFLLAAQYPNGGWPQYYPLKRGYSAHITFNDSAMINVMTLLSDIRDRKTDFAFVDAARRAAAAAALDRGIDCILKCQIVHEGRRLAWCAQHDEETFQPRPARSYELASLSGSESVGIVEFLMAIDHPSPQIIAAIEGAVRWFDEAKLTGIRLSKMPAPGTPKGYDKIIVSDPDAPPLWARFYQIGTNKPIFCSRDGVPRDRLADISYERRNDYSWYTSEPARLLNASYPAWRQRWTPTRNVLEPGTN